MTFRHLAIGVGAITVTALSACGGRAAQGGTDHAGTDDGLADGAASDGASPLPACAWPASLDRADATTNEGNDRCAAARAYLTCAGSNGTTELCLSDDPTKCPNASPIPGVTFSNCQNRCRPDEYAVACGGPGPGVAPSPPATCRSLAATPGGSMFYCCPCEAPSDGGAATFACGASATCDARAEICEHVQGGAPPGVDFFQCAPMPTSCASAASCACLLTALRGRGAAQCAPASAGFVVDIDVP